MMATTITIHIDHAEHVIAPGLAQGHTLLQLAGIAAPQQLLLDIHNDIDIPIGADDWIVLKGGEHFVVGSGQNPTQDNPCMRHPIQFHLNGSPIPAEQAFHHAKVSASDIKRLDPHARDNDGVVVDLSGLADEPLKDGWRLVLQKWYHFIIVPCGNVGLQGVLEQQLSQVQAHYPDAKLEMDNGVRYLVIPSFSVPEHWNISTVTLMAVVPNGYPVAAPDMFWVDGPLRLNDGREPAGAQCYEQHLGRQWQRFSWHYADGQAWSTARSSLLSHVQFAVSRLQQAM